MYCVPNLKIKKNVNTSEMQDKTNTHNKRTEHKKEKGIESHNRPLSNFVNVPKTIPKKSERWRFKRGIFRNLFKSFTQKF